MITLQYTYDNTGNRTGVFLAIEDWDQLKQIPGVNEISQTEVSIPDWHIELGRKELKKIVAGTADLMEWSEAKKMFKL